MTRLHEAPLAYRVEIFLPDQRHHQTDLRWCEQGRPVLDPELPGGWAREETLKLARVLKRTAQPTLQRWRAAPSGAE